MKIQSIKKIEGEYKVSDLRVRHGHHYLLKNGVISHNSGGEGAYYSASTLAFLSRSVIYDDILKTVTGIRLAVKLEKSRHTKDTLKGAIRLDHNMGMDRYYGLLELARDLKLITLEGNRYRFPDERIAFQKAILASPEEFWNQDTLKGLEALVQTTFKYGKGSVAAPMMMADEEAAEAEAAAEEE